MKGQNKKKEKKKAPVKQVTKKGKKKQIMIIYKIQNKKDGKTYIGQTIRTVEDRVKRHLKRGKNHIAHALRKYGIESFDISVIDMASSLEELKEKEKYWIKHFNCKCPHGYNLTDGGDGRAGSLNSQETRNKISKSLTGKPLSETHKNILKENHVGTTGYHHSEETKKRIRETNIKTYSSPEMKSKWREMNLGDKNPAFGKPSHKRGKKCSLETRLKMSIASKGRKHSEETKHKMSEAHKKRNFNESV